MLHGYYSKKDDKLYRNQPHIDTQIESDVIEESEVTGRAASAASGSLAADTMDVDALLTPAGQPD